MSTKIDLGKAAERQVQLWLESRSDRDVGFAFHRFPDARAARGSLASQPSDHLVVHKGEVTFLETKSTKELRRLPRANVSQYGSLLKFHLAGAKVVLVVNRSSFNDWVLLRNEDLFSMKETPTSFLFLGLETFPSAALALERAFQ